MLGGAGAAALLWWSGLLSPAPGLPGDAAEQPAVACRVQLPELRPALGQASEAPAPISTLAGLVALDEALLRKMIEERVPVGLASERGKPIGAPGKLSYTVSRGRVSLAVERDALVVTTPIHVGVQVCKPFGPLCPVYGTCSPQLTARAAVPLVLKDYELEPARVTTHVDAGCNMVGLDFTSQVASLAAGQGPAAAKRINDAIPDVRPMALELAKAVRQPMALGDAGGCLVMEPLAVRQAHPVMTEGLIRLGVSAELRIRHQPACPPSPPEGEVELPPLTTEGEPQPTPSVVVVPVATGWDEVGAALQVVLSAERAGAHEITAVEVAPTAGGAVAVGLTLRGEACGPIWVQAEPFFDASAGVIGLRAPTLLGDAPGLDRLGDEIVAHVTAHGRIPVPRTAASGFARLQELVAMSGNVQLSHEALAGSEVAVAEATTVVVPVAHREGLVTLLRATGTVRVTVRERAAAATPSATPSSTP